MWNTVRWIFPVIFGGIMIFKIYGYSSVPKPQPLPTEFPDPNTKEPYAVAGSKSVREAVDEPDEPAEPPQKNLPVVVVLSAVALTAGYFGVWRVWARK